MVNSAFHPYEVNQMSTRISGDLVVKKKLSPRSGSVVLKQLKPIQKNAP